MKIYLDIDATIKNTAASQQDVIRFLEYCLDNHQVHWLTTHCRNGCNRTYEALDFLPDYLRQRAFEEIRETVFNVLKTDAIDFKCKFLWFDDTILLSELDVLLLNNADKGFFRIETNDSNCLEEALQYLKMVEREER